MAPLKLLLLALEQVIGPTSPKLPLFSTVSRSCWYLIFEGLLAPALSNRITPDSETANPEISGRITGYCIVGERQWQGGRQALLIPAIGRRFRVVAGQVDR